MKSLTAAVVMIGLMSGGAQAATVFADNFDADRTGAKRDFDRFLQFTVSDGTVDYMRQGTYKLSCAGGKGGCVDLDGSTLDAGVMTSTAFALTKGATYTINFDLAGNGRVRSSDSVSFGITGGLFDGAVNAIAWNQLFQSYTYSFVAARTGRESFFIGTEGGDYFGPLLDNVLISESNVPTAAPELPSVPLPATLPLLAGGIAAAGLLRRRKG